jgi:post-segregation antitoxin (ccd killing protein)
MDISKNPGLTATLYNVGNSRQRAAAIAAKNRSSGATVWPEENYYGWLINDKLDELQGLL